MAQITVTSSQVQSKADMLQSYNNQLNSQIGFLQKMESSLMTMWEGEAKNKFHSEFNKDIAQMQNFYAEINQYVAKLKEIVKSYEEAERKNVQTATVRTYK